MTPGQALDLLKRTILNRSSCGRLTEKEREAIEVLRALIRSNASNSEKEEE